MQPELRAAAVRTGDTSSPQASPFDLERTWQFRLERLWGKSLLVQGYGLGGKAGCSQDG